VGVAIGGRILVVTSIKSKRYTSRVVWPN
jgi:hypothetical protein